MDKMTTTSRRMTRRQALRTGASVLGLGLAWELPRIWLWTTFSGEERHCRRVAKMAALDRRFPLQELLAQGQSPWMDNIRRSWMSSGELRRLIREGMVIYPHAERTAGLDSLKRFKEDVGEVREGFECGIKIAGYDDVKVGDVIEAFRVDQVQRTL